VRWSRETAAVRRHLKRAAVLALGWLLVGIGIIGLFLPLLQGLLMIALGLYVLSRESRRVHDWVERMRARHPALDRGLSEVRRRFHRGDADESAPGSCPAAVDPGLDCGCAEDDGTADQRP
jgi:hypothetical protein